MPAVKSEAKLIDGPIGKTLVSLTIPMIIGIMAVIAFNMLDTYFVGQLGTIELAALSFTFPVVFVIGSISLGLGVGASSAVARAIGEGDKHKVKRLTTDSLVLAIVIVVSFVIAGLLTIEPLFRLIGASEDILPYIKRYMVIWYPGMAFLIIPMVGNGAIRATGDTKTPGIVMVVSVVVNLILDPLLIFGYGPFPRWEIEGAAVATVIARAVTLVFSIWILHWREKMITLKPPSIKEAMQSWKNILYVGLPASGTNLIIPVSMGVITRIVSGYGPESVAGFGVAVRVEAFALTVIMAISSVMVPFCGQNWGAGQLDRVRKAVQLGQRFSMAWGGLMLILFLVSAGWIGRLFSTNTAVIETIKLYLWLVPFTYGLQGVLMLSGSTFNALNKPMPSAVLSALRMAILYIPLAYLGSRLFQLRGVFGAAAVANIIAGIAAYYWLRKTLSFAQA